MGWIIWGSIPGRCKRLSLLQNIHASSGSPPNLLFNKYSWLFPREKSGRGMKLTSHLHLMLMIRISRASPLPPFAFVVCTRALHRTSPQINILLWWTFHYTKGTQVPGTRLPARLNCVCWCLIFVGPQYGTCIMSPFWHLYFWDGI